MASIFGGQELSDENVSEMPLAIRANDFSSLSVGVGMPGHGSGQFIVETRPAAAAVEFLIAGVERIVALSAEVGALGFVVLIFACASVFGALEQDHSFLIFGQRVIGIGHGH